MNIKCKCSNTYQKVLLFGYLGMSLLRVCLIVWTKTWETSVYVPVGANSQILPVLGLIIAAWNSTSATNTMVGVLLLYGIVWLLAFLIVVFCAVFRNKDIGFATVVCSDAAFTVLFVVKNIIYAGWLDAHFFWLLSALLNTILAIWFIQLKKKEGELSKSE